MYSFSENQIYPFQNLMFLIKIFSLVNRLPKTIQLPLFFHTDWQWRSKTITETKQKRMKQLKQELQEKI